MNLKATFVFSIGLLCLLCLMLPGSLSADTVNYTITFTNSSGIAPTSGSFSYDTGTNTFTSLQVIWDGYTFNGTARANDPQIFNPTGCTGESSDNGQYGFAIMTQTLTGCTTPIVAYEYSTMWFVNSPTNGYGFAFYDVGSYAGTNEDAIGAFVSIGNATPTAYGFGSWTVTETPEPPSLLLFGTGLLGLLVLAARR